jgi:hypothetical protein
MNGTHEQKQYPRRMAFTVIGISVLTVVVFTSLTIFMLLSLRGTGPCKVAAENVAAQPEKVTESPEPEPTSGETTSGQSTLSIDGQASPNQATVLKEREAEQLRQLDTEVAKVDSDAAETRHKIEVWYTDAHARLKGWAEKRQKELDNAERAAYTWCMQQMQNTRSVTQRDLSANGYTYGSGYVSPYGQLYGSGGASVQGRSSETTTTHVVGDPAGQYREALIQIRQARQAVEQEFVKLQNERQRALNELVNNERRTRDTIELKKRRVQNDTERILRGGPPLIVEAVGIAGDNRHYAVIDNQFVYEGSTIKGYKVRKIDAGSQRVELERNGQVFVLP